MILWPPPPPPPPKLPVPEGKGTPLPVGVGRSDGRPESPDNMMAGLPPWARWGAARAVAARRAITVNFMLTVLGETVNGLFVVPKIGRVEVISVCRRNSRIKRLVFSKRYQNVRVNEGRAAWRA